MIKSKAIRTNCCTGKKRDVDIKLQRVWHASNFNRLWLEITEGAVTGFESIEIQGDTIERTARTGWHACAGTKRRWDTLFITPREMKKIWQSVKSDPVDKKDDGWYFWNEIWSEEYGPFASEEECRKAAAKYAEENL